MTTSSRQSLLSVLLDSNPYRNTLNFQSLQDTLVGPST